MSQSGSLKVTDGGLPSDVPISFITDSGTATAAANILLVNGAGNTTTSGSGNQIVITSTGGGSGGASTFVTNSGSAIQVGGVLNVLGAGSIVTSGAGSTVTVQLSGLTNHTVLLGNGTSTINALANGTNGQVLTATVGSDPSWKTPFGSLTPQTGTSPVTPSAGTININGATVAAGTNPVRTDGTGASTLAVEVQLAQAIASTDATKVGLASFNSAFFNVDANGFVSVSGSGFVETLTGNSGGAISPSANNINTVGTGSITIAGSGSTLTTQLTGLTNHAILVGAGTATITKLAIGSTGQVLQANTAADPTWSTATYPSVAGTSGTILTSNGTNFVNTTATYPATTTVNNILYSSSTNVVGQITTQANAVLTTNASGVPSWTSLMANGDLLIGSGAGAPIAATLTAGTGISITNGANSITIATTGGGFTWVDVTGTTQTIAVSTGYITDNGANVTYTLPATAALGDIFIIMGKLGLTTIAQNANQQILLSSASSTVGVGGSIAGTNVGDCITLVAIVSGSSTVWRAKDFVGNWTVT